MAASMRLRLRFDGNICTYLSPRKCWFLVNLDSCNVVADLEYLIRERFQVHRGLNIRLYLDDFVLPSMEKISVVRDNDTLRVELTEHKDVLQPLDTSPTLSSEPDVSEEISSDAERKCVQTSKRKTKKRKSSSRSPKTNHRQHNNGKLDHKLHKETVGEDNAKLQNGKKKEQQREKHSEGEKAQNDCHNERQETPSQSQPCDASSVDKTCTTLKSVIASSQDQQNKSLKGSLKRDSPTTSKVKRKGKKKSKAASERLDDLTKKAKHSERSRKASKSSKKHRRSVSEMNGVAKDTEKQGKVAKMSGVTSNGSQTQIMDSVASSVSQVEISKMSADQISSDGSRMSKKKKLTPLRLSVGHIRFVSETESDSDSSSEDSDLVNEEPDEVKNKEQISSEIASEKSVEKLPIATDQPSTENEILKDSLAKNQTIDRSAPTPPERNSLDIQPPTSADLIPNEEQIAKDGILSSRGESSARGREFAKGNGGNWDKSQLTAVPAPSDMDLPDVDPQPSDPVPNKRQLQKDSSPSTRGACSSRGKGFGNRGNWDKKSQLDNVQRNKSVIIQNSLAEPPSLPKDFASFPALVGPPRQGDVIAYKILELSESYCPELSDFKEAKVLSVDVPSGSVEVELLSVAMVTKPSKPGKFDLQWEGQEESEDIYSDTIDQNTMVCLQLQDLVDPRLVPSTSA